MRSIFTAALVLFALSDARAEEWPQYRGPGGTGIVQRAVPTTFGLETNVVWAAATPNGASSPVLSADLVFLTGYEDERLYVLALDRANGETLWRREVPRPRKEDFNQTHGPASTTPVTDGESVYAFFGDFGLISFDSAGQERWRMPLGPFRNINGHGSSPVLDGDRLLLLVDQNIDSYLLAIDKDSGQVIWRADRSEVTRSYATPGVFRPSTGPPQVVVPGAYRVISYDLETGEKLWWVNRMAWQLKCVPLFDGDTIYINAWENGGDVGQQKDTDSFDAVLAAHDADGDGLLSREEVPDQRLAQDRPWIEHDLDGDGLLNRRDWDFYAARRAPVNNLVAIRPEGRLGDITASAVLWRYSKSLPNTPSPLLYDRILYLVKDGGIFQSINTKTGEPFKLDRLGPDSIDKYWASPVMAGGKLYLLNQGCTVTVVQPGEQWRVVAVNPLEGYCLSTPAVADGRLYLRTDSQLFAFGER